MVSYKPLFETLERKGLSQYDLEQMGVDHRLLDKIRHNRNITVETLGMLCVMLKCTPNDILEIVPTADEISKIESQRLPRRRNNL